MTSLSLVKRDCSTKCYPTPHRLNITTNECEITNCGQNDSKIYEYNNECYETCPIRTRISPEDEYICEDLNCTYSYGYDQEECFSEIPDGYYLENETLKILGKCHSHCKNCNGPENIKFENCKSCPYGKFLYLNNCTENCTNGYFTDPNDTSSYICKCDDIKCYYCSFESNEYNLCESCNIKEGYYPKINDSLNIYQFINCYNDLKGYYLDYNESIYKPCNSKCETCTGHGDEINNNCQTCISGYSFLND